MTFNDGLQGLLVSILLSWSAWRFLRTIMPGVSARFLNRLAQRISRSGWSRLGAWLQSGQELAGCGSGCATCGSCTTSVKAAETGVVKWRGSEAGS